ncbi:MAG: TolC family protein [Bacteroidota bacterium]|nr:TolC family protein [Bacteroidota bacterium]
MDKIVMRVNKLLWILILLVCSKSLPAQEHPSTIVFHNVDEAIAYAKKHNLDRSIQELQQNRTQTEHKLSKSYLLPTVSGSFTAQNNLNLATTPIPGELVGQPGTLVNVQFGQDYNYNAGITITQTVLDWQNSIKSRIAKIGTEMAQVQSSLFDEKLTEQIALFYYSALLTQKALEINQKDHSLADSIRALTQDKFNNGLIDKSSLNQAVINVNNIEQNVLANRSSLEQSFNQLKNLLGLPADSNIELPEVEKTEEQGFPISETLAMDKNILLYEHQLEKARLDVKQQRALHYPKLSLNAYFGQQQFQNDFTFSLDGEAWTDYSYMGLNLSVPIFTGLANHNKTKVSKIEYGIAQKNLEQEKQQSALRDDLLLKEYGISLQALATAYDNFMLYHDNVDLTFQKFQQGIIGLDAYFKVFEDYLKAENNYLNTLSNVYGNYATILSRKNDNEL